MQRVSSDKDINCIVIGLTKAGWSIGKGKKHRKLISPRGFKLTIPCSPSDNRAVNNFRTQVRALSQNKEC